MSAFMNYVMSFYGPGEIHGDFFHHALTMEEVKEAIALRMQLDIPFSGDSFDRELVRDILLRMHGSETVEYGPGLVGLSITSVTKRKRRKAYARSE
jgi:hypothetical protein